MWEYRNRKMLNKTVDGSFFKPKYQPSDVIISLPKLWPMICTSSGFRPWSSRNFVIRCAISNPTSLVLAVAWKIAHNVNECSNLRVQNNSDSLPVCTTAMNHLPNRLRSHSNYPEWSIHHASLIPNSIAAYLWTHVWWILSSNWGCLEERKL